MKPIYLLKKMAKRLTNVSKIKHDSFFDFADRFAYYLGRGLAGKKNNSIHKDLFIDIHIDNKQISYYTMENDKINMRNDFLNLKSDFAKSTKEAKLKVEYGQACATE
jgi:hypothetical protein